MPDTNQLNLIVAHGLEAEPLIELFQLKQTRRASPFKLLGNESGVNLVVSGMGKERAAGATSRLAAMQQCESADAPVAAWLNVGIAGHQSLSVGSGVIANKITDSSSGAAFFPALILSDYASSALITVDRPEQDYPENAAYDMEAAGFWPTAAAAGAFEFAQAYKIVSDNPSQPTEKVDAALVRRLLLDQAGALLRLVKDMQGLVAEHNAIYRLPETFARIQSRARFSVTQQNQLQRLCRRFQALGLNDRLEQLPFGPGMSSREIIAQLKAALAESG